MTILYFAYGSNMLTERLVRRCASARVLGRAMLPGFDVAFSKIGRDDTGKATLVAAGKTAAAHGVVFELSRDDILTLDKIEGLGQGYHRIERATLTLGGCRSQVGATTYIAEPHHVAAGLRPFNWYRDLVLAGALQHALPRSYCDWLAAHPAHADDDATRKARREAIDILSSLAATFSARG